MQRRDLLLHGAAACGLGLLPVGRSAWAAAGDAAATPAMAGRRLVVVFLRGAVDGLNVVAPVREAAYAAARPTIALAAPGAEGGALELDGRFGLHPALAPLMPLWQAGRLGFVHAAGSHDATRSHFDAQDYMESATPGRKSTPDGWLNRLLGVLPAPAERAALRGSSTPMTRAVSLGAVLPRIYAGSQPVANIALGTAATRPTVLDRPAVGQAFDRLYAGDDAMARAYQAAQRARRDVRDALEGDEAMAREMLAANNGAPLPNGFPADATRLATLMRNDPRVQLAFVALGGWDTHANQGAATGQLASRLAPLGQGLAQFARTLGPAFDDTVVLVLSEFGRTAYQNGNGGTDHGHGNVMWLLGGPVSGGKVHGRWPGMDDAALNERRDLAITTDFRAVLAQVLERHLRLSDAQLETVLPQWQGGQGGDGLPPLFA